jgi:hypothetical protein
VSITKTAGTTVCCSKKSVCAHNTTGQTSCALALNIDDLSAAALSRALPVRRSVLLRTYNTSNRRHHQLRQRLLCLLDGTCVSAALLRVLLIATIPNHKHALLVLLLLRHWLLLRPACCLLLVMMLLLPYIPDGAIGAAYRLKGMCCLACS